MRFILKYAPAQVVICILTISVQVNTSPATIANAANDQDGYTYDYDSDRPDIQGEPTRTENPRNHSHQVPDSETPAATNHKHRDERETAFLDGMLVNYDQRIRPNDNDFPVKANVSIFVNTFYAVNEQTMDYKLNIFLRLRWNDPRLSHNFSTEHVSMHQSMLAKIWTPDVFFSNEKHATFHSVPTENKLLRVYQNGDVYTSVRMSLTLSCDMHLSHFPMDFQICNIKLESFGYDMKSLIFNWDGDNAVQLPEALQLPQFLIRGYKVKKCTKEYSTGSFPCLVAEFILQRQMGYYIIQMYAPSLLIVILSWVAFWINMDAAPARTALGITTVLTMTTQSAGARASLPKVSYVKAIDVWFAVCLVFVFAALLEFAVVNFLSRQEKAFFKLGTNIANLSKRYRSSKTRKRKDIEEEKHTPQQKNRKKYAYLWKARRIDRLSRVLFPLVFVIFNVFYWAVYKIARDDLQNALEWAIPYQE